MWSSAKMVATLGFVMTVMAVMTVMTSGALSFCVSSCHRVIVPSCHRLPRVLVQVCRWLAWAGGARESEPRPSLLGDVADSVSASSLGITHAPPGGSRMRSRLTPALRALRGSVLSRRTAPRALRGWPRRSGSKTTRQQGQQQQGQQQVAVAQ